MVSPAATALALAGLIWNRDLSGYDPDGPLPGEEPAPPDDSGAFGAGRVKDAQATVAHWRQESEANGWSLRETVIRLGRRAGGHVGTPGGLADKFAHFVRHGALDGFNVSPYIVPHGLDDIVDLARTTEKPRCNRRHVPGVLSIKSGERRFQVCERVR